MIWKFDMVFVGSAPSLGDRVAYVIIKGIKGTYPVIAKPTYLYSLDFTTRRGGL